MHLIRRWYELSTRMKIDKSRLGATSDIAKWFESTPTNAKLWPMLFQMKWDDTATWHRDSLFSNGLDWLHSNDNNGAWSHIWPRLWHHRPGEHSLIEAGLTWVACHPSHPGWSYVWQPIFDHGSSSHDLVEAGLLGIAEGPENQADLPLWKKVEQAKPDPSEFARALIRKLVRSRSPYKLEERVAFLVERVAAPPLQNVLREELRASMGETRWPFFWTTLLTALPQSLDIRSLGRGWLAGREDRPEWAFVWRRLLDEGFEREAFLAAGRGWLAGREDRPDYRYVFRRVRGYWPGT